MVRTFLALIFRENLRQTCNFFQGKTTPKCMPGPSPSPGGLTLSNYNYVYRGRVQARPGPNFLKYTVRYVLLILFVILILRVYRVVSHKFNIIPDTPRGYIAFQVDFGKTITTKSEALNASIFLFFLSVVSHFHS